MSRPRVLLIVLGVLVGSLAATTVAVPASACACGGFVPPPGTEVSAGEEHAIVSWDGRTEQIDVVLGMLSTASDTGLVFPTPGPAAVELGSPDEFAAVAAQMRPERVTQYDWWSLGGLGGTDGVAGSAPEVLDQVQLGPVEATTLAANDASGLATWLGANGYVVPAALEPLLAGYVERGWYFVALRLTGETPLEGELDPLRFTFETDEFVYPLALSQAAMTPQTVKLYVLGDGMHEAGFVDGSPMHNASVTWSGPVDESSLAERGEWLTAVELWFGQPGTEIAGDLVLSRAADDARIADIDLQVVTIGVGGVGAGWLLLGFGLPIVLIAGVVALSRRPRHER